MVDNPVGVLLDRRREQHDVVARAELLQKPVHAGPHQVVLFVVFVVDQRLVQVQHQRVLEPGSDRRDVRRRNDAFFGVAHKVRLQLGVDLSCKLGVFVVVDEQLAAFWHRKVVSVCVMRIAAVCRLELVADCNYRLVRGLRRRQVCAAGFVLRVVVVAAVVVCSQVDVKTCHMLSALAVCVCWLDSLAVCVLAVVEVRHIDVCAVPTAVDCVVLASQALLCVVVLVVCCTALARCLTVANSAADVVVKTRHVCVRCRVSSSILTSGHRRGRQAAVVR